MVPSRWGTVSNLDLFRHERILTVTRSTSAMIHMPHSSREDVARSCSEERSQNWSSHHSSLLHVHSSGVQSGRLSSWYCSGFHSRRKRSGSFGGSSERSACRDWAGQAAVLYQYSREEYQLPQWVGLICNEDQAIKLASALCVWVEHESDLIIMEAN